MKTGNGLVGAIFKINIVQVRIITIAKKLVRLKKMKIYLHSLTILYILDHFSTAVNRSYKLKQKTAQTFDRGGSVPTRFSRSLSHSGSLARATLRTVGFAKMKPVACVVDVI